MRPRLRPTAVRQILLLIAFTSTLTIGIAAPTVSPAQSLQELGFFLGGNRTEVSAISADGTVAVGQVNDAQNNVQAFRWVNGVLTGLGTLPGYTGSRAEAVSADGSVIVGTAFQASGTDEQAFRWANGTMTGLGFLPGATAATDWA